MPLVCRTAFCNATVIISSVRCRATSGSEKERELGQRFSPLGPISELGCTLVVSLAVASERAQRMHERWRNQNKPWTGRRGGAPAAQRKVAASFYNSLHIGSNPLLGRCKTTLNWTNVILLITSQISLTLKQLQNSVNRVLMGAENVLVSELRRNNWVEWRQRTSDGLNVAGRFDILWAAL